MEISKRFVLLIALSFAFILFQTPYSFAQVDDSSSDESAVESADDTFTEIDDSELLPVPFVEEVVSEEAAPDKNNKNNKDKKPIDDSSEEVAAPESMAMSMATGGTSGSSTGGSFSTPEAVSVSQVGAASFGYPIAVPPGRNGLQPNISLSYSSYNGNGWLGVGWDLDLGSIKRSTKNGLDYSGTDFVANGSELVANSGWGSNYYCKKIEGGFTKYYFNTGSNYWIAYAKDGTKYYYGQSSASRMTNTNGTYSWHLDKVEDTNGNYMTITYTKISSQIYPSQISYTGNSGLSPNKTVEFELENRTDIIRSYKTKSLVTTSKRLKTITVKVGTTTVYKYSLDYEYSPGNGRSRLVDITRIDPDNPSNTLPPTEFSWLDGGDGTFGTTSTMSLAGDSTDSKIAFGDINGDGREDFIKYYFLPYQNYYKVYSIPYLANDSGGFSQQYTTYLGLCLDPDSMRIAMGDINGDGWADIVGNVGGWFGSFLSDGDGTFSMGSDMLGLDDNISAIYLVDLNGDGLADLVRYNSSEGKVWSHLSYGNGNFECFGDEHLFDLYYLSETLGGTLHFGDVNGDGITDLCAFNTVWLPNSTSYVYIFLGNGSGEFDTYYTSLYMGSYSSSRKGALADVNGDGLTDLLYYYSSNMYVYISTGTGKTGPYVTNVTGFTSAADINDDGMADLITGSNFYQSKGDGYFYPAEPAGGPTGSDLYLADIDGNGRPDKIKYNESSISYAFANGDVAGAGDHIELITNPLGGETSVTYGNNTDIDYTTTDTNRVPFTLHPVMDIVTDDGYTVSLTTYAYSGGYYDYEERDFRGFSTVTLTRPDYTTVTTTYEQEDDYLKGRPLTIEMRDLCLVPSLFKEITFTWDTYPLPNADAEFVKLTNKRTDIYGTTNVYTNEANLYDDTNGNLLRIIKSGTGNTENIRINNTYVNIGTWIWRKSREQLYGMSDTSQPVRRTDYTYDINGNLLTKKYINYTGTNPIETYTYDSYGNIATYKDPKYNITNYNYDTTYTYVTSIDYPTTGGVTHSVDTTYNDFGKLESETDENNNPTYYYYDAFGRLNLVEYPDGGETEYTYVDRTVTTPAYIKTSVLNDTEPVETYQYVDGFGRAIMNVSKGLGNNNIITIANYDNMGRVYKTEGPYLTDNFTVSNPFSHTPLDIYPTVEKEFDFAGRVVTVKTPQYLGSTLDSYDTTTIDYDGFVTTITQTDTVQYPSRVITRVEVTDYLGRIIEVQEDTGGGTTTYYYNAAGDLTDIYDNGNINHTDIEYNTLGQKTSMDDPDMGVWSYTYDLNGNLYQQTDAKGQIIRFTYDALNRITLKNYYNTSDPDVYYYYDNTSIDNGRGRLYSVSNANVTTTYNDYDEMGRVLSVTKTITGDQARTTHFTYDLSGKQRGIIYPGSIEMVENIYYPGTNLLYKVKSFWDADYAEITDYTASGKIKTLNYYNGSSTTYTYDPRSDKLSHLLTEDGYYGTTIQEKSYNYTSIGEISSINDIHNSVTYSYTYDKLSRLTEENSGSTMSVTYSAIGNIESKTIGGNSFDFQYNNSNHPHAVSRIVHNGNNYDFYYDANGNMEFGYDFTNPANPIPRFSDLYNADNMLAGVGMGGPVTLFLYDGMGTRVKKSVGSTHTYYIGEHFEVRDGTTVLYIFAGNLRVAQLKGSVLSFFHKDHLGSSTVMTDINGAELESTEYMPFGSERSHTGTDTSAYRFTDQELDGGAGESGLYNYGARLYDPFLGRFISPDTIVPQPFNPQSLNRYSYVLNNPLIYTDPSGHFQNYCNDPNNPCDEYTLDEIVVTYDEWDWVKQLEQERAAILEQINSLGNLAGFYMLGLWDLKADIEAAIQAGYPGGGGGGASRGASVGSSADYSRSDGTSGGESLIGADKTGNQYKEGVYHIEYTNIAYLPLEGIAINGTYRIAGYYEISKGEVGNYNLTASVTGTTTASSQGSIFWNGRVTLNVNGIDTVSSVLTVNQSEARLNSSGSQYIGKATLPLPSSGIVDMRITTGYFLAVPGGMGVPFGDANETINIYK